jgi:Zn-dependent protease with chaperone function
MALRTRMAVAIFLLFGLLFAFFMGLIYLLLLLEVVEGVLWIFILPVILAVAIVLLQYGISPYILKWIYKIEWVGPDEGGFPDQRTEDVYRKIGALVQQEGIAMPKVGIVPDNNPNAFTFGWTRNRSFLVLTAGVFKYCDDEEVEAVAAHEVGHITHNDFVVMTVISAVVLLFYVVAMGAYFTARFSRGGGRNSGYIAAVAIVVAAISFVVYILANYISLLVSRYREYWADEFSADSTRHPNKLSSALVKIAYGLATEGRGLEKRDRAKHDTRHANTMGIFNSKAARALAVQAATPSGTISREAIQETMAWDLWNPWAFFYELGSTHPLPAKRILSLGKNAEEKGQTPYMTFDLEKPESYWDDFLRDVLVKHSWWLVSIPVCFGLFWFDLVPLILIIPLFLFMAGLLGFLYLRFYHYPPGFRDAKVQELLRDPKASPVRGTPVRLRGRVIGRGVPGLFFSEDLKIDDGTGLLLIDYRSIFRFLDFLMGMFATQQLVGQEVTVEGWYRRPVVPMLELRRLLAGDGRGRTVYRPYIEMVLVALVMAVGAIGTLLVMFL